MIRRSINPVIPAQAGIQTYLYKNLSEKRFLKFCILDSRLRGNDDDTKRGRLKNFQTASSVFPNSLGIHQIHVFGFVGAVQCEKRQNAVGGKVEADADDAVVRIEFDGDQCGDGRADDGGEIICQ